MGEPCFSFHRGRFKIFGTTRVLDFTQTLEERLIAAAACILEKPMSSSSRRFLPARSGGVLSARSIGG